MKKKKSAFTMAEVLIAIAIIGVIAALVLPVMMKNYNNRIFATKARRAYTAVVDACSHGLSDDQVKYPGDIINSYCEYIPGKSCTTGENGSVILKDGTVITLSGWGNNPGGDLEVTIDTNDTKGPNADGKDRWYTKLTRDCKLADDGSNKTISYLKAHDWKISDEDATAQTPAEPELTEEEKQALALAKRRDFTKWTVEEVSPMSESDCNAIKDKYGISCRPGGNDYWAAAVDKCGGTENLPSESDLHALAKELYPSCNDYDGTPTNTYTGDCTGSLDQSKLAEYPGLSGLGSSWNTLWSGSEYSSTDARNRAFFSSGSGRGSYYRSYGSFMGVVCLGDLK